MSLYLVKDPHPHVYFITDSFAARGSDDYETLMKWCQAMHVDVGQVKFIARDDKNYDAKRLNQSVMSAEVKVVAIGFEAMDHLLELGVDEFFVLPDLDSKHKSVDRKLNECRTYIYKGVPTSFKEMEDGLEEG